MYTQLAPIILFVYNRPWHTQQTIKALQRNVLAFDSELYIYSDAPKKQDDQLNVQEIRRYIHSIDGFKKITIIEHEKNWGLADSIIHGVTEVVNKYGRVIVLEDDMITSPHFLTFMNEALRYYKNTPSVWNISGWNYPIPSTESNQAFLWRVMNCWGWATWSDRWEHFDKNPTRIINTWTTKDIHQFNLDGYEDFWSQVTSNQSGAINTWAIFWYATIFERNGLCLNPTVSYLRNIGLDGSGENCIPVEEKCIPLNTSNNVTFPHEIIEEKAVVSLIKQHYKLQPSPPLTRLKRFLKQLLPTHED